METLTTKIRVAMHEEQADLVFAQATVVDVFTLTTYVADVAVQAGVIVGIGTYPHAKTRIDAKGKYLVPGLIDAHVHIESSLLTPSKFASLSLQHGVTTVITDPHEIANVLGREGIEFMLAASEAVGLDVFVMASSCVPATDFETSGATLRALDLRPLYDHPRVLGLAEMMNYPGVLEADPEVMAKLIDAHERGLIIDGHGPGLNADQLNGYITAGVTTDHECEAHDEVQMRLSRGMYVLIRQGTAAKNLAELVPMVTDANNQRFCFCTDDKHADELLSEGSIDHAIRLAIAQGMDPLMAIRLGTLNSAQCYRFTDRGAIAPGYIADCLLVDDLTNFTIAAVYKAGQRVNPQAIAEQTAPQLGRQTVHLPAQFNLALPLRTSKMRALGIIPGQLLTREVLIDCEPTPNFTGDVSRDLAKLVVIERHHVADESCGFAVVQGFGLARGAIATTIAHDSHNVLAIGMNDADLTLAIRTLEQLQGGIVVVADGQVIASLQLEVAGLMTDRPLATVLAELAVLNQSVEQLGFSGQFHPFLTLSFLSLPVIPKLKVTNKGLFDVEQFQFVPIEIET